MFRYNVSTLQGFNPPVMLAVMHHLAPCTAVYHRLASCTVVFHRLASSKFMLIKRGFCSLDKGPDRVTARGLKSPLLQPSEPVRPAVSRRHSTCFVLLHRVSMPQTFGLSFWPALDDILSLFCFQFIVGLSVCLFRLLYDLPSGCPCPAFACIAAMGVPNVF
jgi:hypothetical protein